MIHERLIKTLCTFLRTVLNSDGISLYALFTQIPDNYEGYSLDMFCLPKHYENDVESILIPRGLIFDR